MCLQNKSVPFNYFYRLIEKHKQQELEKKEVAERKAHISRLKDLIKLTEASITALGDSNPPPAFEGSDIADGVCFVVSRAKNLDSHYFFLKWLGLVDKCFFFNFTMSIGDQEEWKKDNLQWKFHFFFNFTKRPKYSCSPWSPIVGSSGQYPRKNIYKVDCFIISFFLLWENLCKTTSNTRKTNSHIAMSVLAGPCDIMLEGFKSFAVSWDFCSVHGLIKKWHFLIPWLIIKYCFTGNRVKFFNVVQRQRQKIQISECTYL